MRHPYRPYGAGYGLNESPSEKEGKCLTSTGWQAGSSVPQ